MVGALGQGAVDSLAPTTAEGSEKVDPQDRIRGEDLLALER